MRTTRHRRLQTLAIVVAAVLPLAILFAIWQGILLIDRHSWDSTKAELVIRGEKLSLREFEPPPVPAERNFFGDAIWTEVIEDDSRTSGERPTLAVFSREASQKTTARLTDLLPDSAVGDSQKDRQVDALVRRAMEAMERTQGTTLRRQLAEFIVETMEESGPTIDHVVALLNRPHAQPALDYSKHFGMRFDHAAPVMNVASALRARAEAFIVLERIDEARADIERLFPLAATISGDPSIVSAIRQIAILVGATDAIQLGIDLDAWSDEDLREFDRHLAGRDLPGALSATLRKERGTFNDAIERLGYDAWKPETFMDAASAPQGLPRAIFRQWLGLTVNDDQSSFNRLMQSWIDALDDAWTTGIIPGDFVIPRTVLAKNLLRPRLLTKLMLPPMPIVVAQVSRAQSRILQCRIACALERHRLRHGALPDALDALAPEFLPAVPTDVIANEPFRYRRTGDTFELWSVGWDATDDGGTAPGARGASGRGDWIWHRDPARRL